MAKRQRKERPVAPLEDTERSPRDVGEVGGFAEEAERGAEAGVGGRHYSGRTIGDTATSYSSVGGVENPEEWPECQPRGEVEAYEDEEIEPFAEEPGATTGPVHDITFRPGPGGYVASPGRRGRDYPYTGEVISTRDATFEEDPNTGKTASEEEGEFVRESLEERTRGYESG